MMDSRSTDSRATENLRSPENVLAGMMTSASKTKFRAGETELHLTQAEHAGRNTAAEARALHHNIFEIYAYSRAADEMRHVLGSEKAGEMIAHANSQLDGVLNRLPKADRPEGLAMEVKPHAGRRKDYSKGLMLHKNSELYIAKDGLVREETRRIFMYEEIEQHFDIHDDWK